MQRRHQAARTSNVSVEHQLLSDGNLMVVWAAFTGRQHRLQHGECREGRYEQVHIPELRDQCGSCSTGRSELHSSDDGAATLLPKVSPR